MLDKEVFKQQMEKLDRLYPRWGADIEDSKTMKVWYEQFKDMSDKEFKNKVDDYIKNNQYTPTVAGILDKENEPNRNMKFVN